MNSFAAVKACCSTAGWSHQVKHLVKVLSYFKYWGPVRLLKPFTMLPNFCSIRVVLVAINRSQAPSSSWLSSTPYFWVKSALCRLLQQCPLVFNLLYIFTFHHIFLGLFQRTDSKNWGKAHQYKNIDKNRGWRHWKPAYRGSVLYIKQKNMFTAATSVLNIHKQLAPCPLVTTTIYTQVSVVITVSCSIQCLHAVVFPFFLFLHITVSELLS